MNAATLDALGRRSWVVREDARDLLGGQDPVKPDKALILAGRIGREAAHPGGGLPSHGERLEQFGPELDGTGLQGRVEPIKQRSRDHVQRT